MIELVLVHCNLADNLYQQKSDLLYNFTPNKSYAYLLKVGPCNSAFLKTYNTQFYEITITFTDQNGGPSEMEDKVKFPLVMNK